MNGYSKEDDEQLRDEWLADLRHLGDHDVEPEFAVRGPSKSAAFLPAIAEGLVGGLAIAVIAWWFVGVEDAVGFGIVGGIGAFSVTFLLRRIDHVERQLRRLTWLIARIETGNDRQLDVLRRRVRVLRERDK